MAIFAFTLCSSGACPIPGPTLPSLLWGGGLPFCRRGFAVSPPLCASPYPPLFVCIAHLSCISCCLLFLAFVVLCSTVRILAFVISHLFLPPSLTVDHLVSLSLSLLYLSLVLFLALHDHIAPSFHDHLTQYAVFQVYIPLLLRCLLVWGLVALCLTHVPPLVRFRDVRLFFSAS